MESETVPKEGAAAYLFDEVVKGYSRRIISDAKRKIGIVTEYIDGEEVWFFPHSA